MQDRFDKLIKLLYRKSKQGKKGDIQPHPDEETFACFLEDKLSEKDADQFKKHITECGSCAEILVTELKLKISEEKAVPEELLIKPKNLLKHEIEINILEIFLKLKEQILEVLNTSGDVLVGQELVPAAVLRSRNIKDFKDEVTIFKDFKDIRIEAKIESKAGEYFSLAIVLKEKRTQELLKDLRITLLMDNLELESYLTDSGRVYFEHIMAGKYTVEISSSNNLLAVIKLEINR